MAEPSSSHYLNLSSSTKHTHQAFRLCSSLRHLNSILLLFFTLCLSTMTQVNANNSNPLRLDVSASTNNLVIQMKNKLSIGGIRRIRLIVTLFADKVPHKPTTMNNLKRIWARYGNVNLTARDERDPEDKILIATAQDEEVAKSILDNSPWSVMGFTVHVQEWPATKAIEDIPTHQISFWIQIRGVPLYLFMEENARAMVSQFGEFICMDDPFEGEDGTYSFLRVRVLFDGSKPLPAGFQLPREDGSVSWVEFKYEKLAKFCYRCGRLGHNHTVRFPCSRTMESQDEEEMYGGWMSIPTFRRPARQAFQQEGVAPQTARRRRPGQLMTLFGSGTVGQNFINQGQSSNGANNNLILNDQPQERMGDHNFAGNDQSLRLDGQLASETPPLQSGKSYCAPNPLPFPTTLTPTQLNLFHFQNPNFSQLTLHSTSHLFGNVPGSSTSPTDLFPCEKNKQQVRDNHTSPHDHQSTTPVSLSTTFPFPFNRCS